MLNDSSSAHSVPKYSRSFSLEHMQPSPPFSAAASLFSADSPVNSGPIITEDFTDSVLPTPADVTCDWTNVGDVQSVSIKEEPSSPEVEECPAVEGGATPVDTPLSPTTFINSLLQENETNPAHNTPTSSPLPANPITAVGPASTGPLPPSTNQSHSSVPTTDSTSNLTRLQPTCQTVACIDR
ncbi:hypothetical protein LDENG_00276770 [Lucifuga dentata]|nr:hypothetical protein LDENG_00276770 [Lucifuga dentata]